VLKDCAEAGYTGIELGPVGYMPEDPAMLAEALAEHGLELIGGVVFRAFHDPAQWDDVLDGAVRTCKALTAHGAQHLVLIDSISPRRAPTAGRADEAEQMDARRMGRLRDRIAHVARWGRGVRPDRRHPRPCGGLHGFRAGARAPAGRGRRAHPEDLLRHRPPFLCGLRSGGLHERHIGRISYMHFKDIDPKVKADVIAKGTGFYDACGQGIFCNLGRATWISPRCGRSCWMPGFEGWCTVEQDCDPTLDVSPIDDARANRAYLASIGF
jgi:inosose dehydratase